MNDTIEVPLLVSHNPKDIIGKVILTKRGQEILINSMDADIGIAIGGTIVYSGSKRNVNIHEVSVYNYNKVQHE